jgi:hypothetical protein
MRRRARSLSELHCYDIGCHLVRTRFQGNGWTASVDGLRHERSYRTEAEAWAAGVALAEAMDGSSELSPPGRGSARSA